MRIYDKTADLSDPSYPMSGDRFTPLCPTCWTPFPDIQGDEWVCDCGHRWGKR